MATKSKATTIKNGTQVEFLGYSDGKGDTFEAGDRLSIVGYDPDDKTYAVENEDGAQDSLYASEFTVIEEDAPVKATKKATTKKTAKVSKVVVEETDEDEDAEEEAEEEVKPAKTTKAAGKKAAETKSTGKGKSASKKTAKVDNEEEVVELPKFKATVSVKAALDAHKGNAIKAALTLAETGEKTVFTLGGVLAHIKRTDAHASILGDEVDEETGKRLPLYEAGNKGFNAYVAAELGFAPRKADYYVNLYEKFSQITTEAAIGKIGWTKLRELLPLELDSENVGEWLDYAKESSTAEVRDAVTKALVDSGEKMHGNSKRGKGDTEVTKMKLNFFADQANVIKEALDKAREVIGEDATPSACFVHIASEWLNMDYDPTAFADEDEGDDD